MARTEQAHTSGRRRAAATRHGHAGSEDGSTRRSPTYYSWQNMLSRCRYPSMPAYRFYGARGITVCDRWRKFENFLADMGERPPGTQISRIDNDGNYEPGNCHWESQALNLAERNRRVAVGAVSLANLRPNHGHDCRCAFHAVQAVPG